MSLISTIRTRIKILSMLPLSLAVAPFISFALVGELAIGGIMILAAATSDKVLVIAAQFASAALDPRVFFGQGYLSSTIVQVGWGFVLSFTNALFIFVLLVIGFAIIFRIGGYTIRETLGRLIIAALLINFSLVIAGLFIDGSNLLAEYFIQASGNEDFGGSIVNQLGLTPGGQPDTSASTVSLGVIPPAWAAIQGLLIQTVFNLVAAFILALIGIMFVVRTIMIWVLLILSPIVWLAWVLPKTETHWHKWWDEFLKWCFFAPIATFFLFLAMTVGTGVNTVLSSNPPDVLTPAYFTSTGITNFLVMLGLMILSLTMAQKHAGVGGDMVKSLAGWGAGAIKGAGMKFSGANMASRNLGALKKEFFGGGAEKERQDIAKARAGEIRSKFNILTGIKSPKEKVKENAVRLNEKINNQINKELKEFRELSPEAKARKLQELRSGVHSMIDRESTIKNALMLAQLQKIKHEVEEDEVWDKPDEWIVDPKTKERQFRKQGSTYKVKKSVPVVTLEGEDKALVDRIEKKMNRKLGKDESKKKKQKDAAKFFAEEAGFKVDEKGEEGGEKESGKEKEGGDKKEGDKE